MPRHESRFRVYYEDTDAGGVMYHAAYLAFAERGRTEAMRAMGAPVAELLSGSGLGFVVSTLSVRYLRPLRLDECVRVGTWLRELGAARCRLRQSLAGDARLAAELEVTLACVRAADHRPARIPPRWRDALHALLGEGAEDFVA